MTTKEVMQMALDVLTNKKYAPSIGETTEALRATLAQPKKEWVGLTDEELLFVRNRGAWTHDIIWSYERAIEAKIKEKNT